MKINAMLSAAHTVFFVLVTPKLFMTSMNNLLMCTTRTLQYVHSYLLPAFELLVANKTLCNWLQNFILLILSDFCALQTVGSRHNHFILRKPALVKNVLHEWYTLQKRDPSDKNRNLLPEQVHELLALVKEATNVN